MPERGRSPGFDARRPCPVCLGLMLQPFALGESLVLDACRRCGGIWFDPGEVARLREVKPESLWARVELRADAFRMKCHRCQASFERNRPRCPACGWGNRLACPDCRRTLTTTERDGLRLDVCERGHGVWFDNTELAEVWNREVSLLAPRSRAAPANVAQDRFLLDALIWAPDPFTLGYIGAGVAGHVAAPAAHALGEVAGTAAEAAGDLAGGVFGAIADIIGGLFDGF